METDLVYYRRRQTDEAAAAETATDSRVRQVHLDLANRYAQRVAKLEEKRTEVHLQLVSAA